MAKVTLMKNNVSCYLIAFKKSEDIPAPMMLLGNGMNIVNRETIYDCIERFIYSRREENINEEFSLPEDI
jgi:hypothetical protein